MGLIKSIFGAIFGLIGGIFKAIGGAVGLGKKSEFFMELDETATASTPGAQLEPVAKAESAAPAKAAAPAAPKAPAQAPVAAAPAEPAPTGFASQYLGTATMPRRRRPGPSLSPFRDMAKQMTGR